MTKWVTDLKSFIRLTPGWGSWGGAGWRLGRRRRRRSIYFCSSPVPPTRACRRKPHLIPGLSIEKRPPFNWSFMFRKFKWTWVEICLVIIATFGQFQNDIEFVNYRLNCLFFCCSERVLDQFQNIESQFWLYSVRWGEKDQWPRPLRGNFGNLEDFWNFFGNVWQRRKMDNHLSAWRKRKSYIVCLLVDNITHRQKIKTALTVWMGPIS